jgi:ribosome maturation protein Sdo1
VDKGEIAKAGDLQTAFGTKDQTKILKRILEEGEVCSVSYHLALSLPLFAIF